MSTKHTVVLDTNVVLDVFLFQDPKTEPLRQQLQSNQIQWMTTLHMRNELERVLTYAHIGAKLAHFGKLPKDILAAFDQFATLSDASISKAPYTCKDPDDQPFIDLACHLVAKSPKPLVQLISKDNAILGMRKRLEKMSVFVSAIWLA